MTMNKKELIDQTAHLTAAFVVLAPVFIAPGALSGAWSGLCLGYVRELTEEGAVVDLGAIWAAFGSWRDLLFWTLGGAIAGLIF